MHKILIIAEAANPEWNSVPLVGWNIYLALSKVTEAHLVTHVRNKPAIDRTGLIEGVDYTAIDNERYAAPIFKVSQALRGGDGKGWTTITAFSSLAYYTFELELWRQFKSRLEARQFDIVHRVTPLSPTSQSVIAARLKKLNIPFVVGPLNGGVPWPPGFLDRQHAEREWLSHVRWLYKFMPAFRSMRESSSAIIVGSRYTARDMPVAAQIKCVHIAENGVRADQVIEHSRLTEKLKDIDSRKPLRAIFIGRLVPYKGADILLEAAAEFLASKQLVLRIVGDGPQRTYLEQLARKLRVDDAVQFLGSVAHSDVFEELRQSDLMVFPSIREFGGGVVIEAMAMGVPPIIADYAGPAELVDHATGLKVPFTDKPSLVVGIKKALQFVLANPERLADLGQAGRKKVLEHFTWEAKADRITHVYSSVLGQTDQVHRGPKKTTIGREYPHRPISQ